jgi:hypothetical protein
MRCCHACDCVLSARVAQLCSNRTLDQSAYSGCLVMLQQVYCQPWRGRRCIVWLTLHSLTVYQCVCICMHMLLRQRTYLKAVKAASVSGTITSARNATFITCLTSFFCAGCIVGSAACSESWCCACSTVFKLLVLPSLWQHIGLHWGQWRERCISKF